MPRHYAEGLHEELNTQAVGRVVVPFDEIDSTNTYALEHGEDGAVYVADRQTAGRGRHGRAWLSTPGVGLWFTAAILSPPQGLVYAAALAVRNALTPDCALRIKWPNDLLLNGKKVCGILVEQRGDLAALGIGLNVSQRPEDFPGDLRGKASSLGHETGIAFDRRALLQRVLTALDRTIMLLRQGKGDTLRAEWAEACDLVGRRVTCGDATGVVLRIDELGALHLDTPAGPVRVLSGDLTVLDGA